MDADETVLHRQMSEKKMKVTECVSNYLYSMMVLGNSIGMSGKTIFQYVVNGIIDEE